VSLGEAVRFVDRPERTAEAYELAVPVSSDAELFRELAAAMEFPDYFGHNWDSVIDALRDVPPKRGDTVTLIVRDAMALWANAPRVAGRFVEIWLLVAEDMSTEGVEYRLVFVW
jgi:RNAse (barnase) inhibitor barstar